MNRQPQIDEIVSFIDRNNPADLEIIRLNNPQFTDILKLGSVLGDSNDESELKVRAIVCFKALEIVVKACDSNLPRIKLKLRNSQRIQLYGQILATISSASVITTLATNHKNITYIAGVLSLIGTLAPLIVDSRKKGIDNSKLLDENYFELVKLKLESEQNIRELNFFIDNNFQVEGISEVINRSNQLCADITLKLSVC